MTEEGYEFPTLPVGTIAPGQTVLVVGRGRLASQVARKLIFDGGHEDGAVFVSTGSSGRTLVEDCINSYPSMDLANLGIVDATGRSDVVTDTAARMEAVSSTADLTGISIKSSILWTDLQKRGIDRVRTCYDSLSLLLLYTDFRTIMRFVHTVDGRVSAMDGFGVFVLDPSMHDPQVEHTLAHVCDGVIEVREERVGNPDLRVDGLPGQEVGWQSMDL